MKTMTKWLVMTFLAMSIGCAWGQDVLPEKPLVVGVVPYNSTRTLLKAYQPMREYLEHALGQPVSFFSASGFKNFQQYTEEGAFDLVITPAHFARILQKERGYIPLVRYSGGARGLVMVKRGSRLKTIQDLRGKSVAAPDRLSLASILCIEYLRAKGLRADTDFKVLEVPSFNSAILAVRHDEAVAAISAPGALAQMPVELRDSVRVLADTGEYINLVFLANPRLGQTTAERLKAELMRFGAGEAGAKFLARTGFGSIVAFMPGDLRPLDPYVAETKKLLGQP
jgi:phosphonate transport system substrate-binding protein